MNWESAILLGYDPKAARSRSQVATASRVEWVPRIVLAMIEALEQSRGDPPVLCHTIPTETAVDGLLGLDFFRGHRLVLDFGAGIITLE